jgi:hypothetical protein
MIMNQWTAWIGRLSRRSGGWAARGAMLVVLMAILAGCGSLADPISAASVGGQGISMGAYTQMLAFMKAGAVSQNQVVDWQTPSGRVGLAGSQKNALDMLVQIALTHEQAVSHHVTVAKQDLKTEVDTFAAGTASSLAQGSTPSARQVDQFARDAQASLKRDGLPDITALLQSSAPNPVMMYLWGQTEQGALISRQLKVPTLHLRLMVLNTQQQAEALEAQVRQGADFGQLAHLNSQDQSTAQQGGELGQIYVGELVAPLDAALFGAGSSKADKYRILPFNGKFLLCEVTQSGSDAIANLKDARTENGVFAGWIRDVVRPAASVQTFVAIDSVASGQS